MVWFLLNQFDFRGIEKVISKNLTNLLGRFLSFPFFFNTSILLRILLHNTREGEQIMDGYLLEGVRR